MSYCRWGTNDFQCDLYVYGSGDDEVTIHVATNRVVFAEPLPEPVSFNGASPEWFARRLRVHDILDKSTRVPIGLPCDGERYDLPYTEAAAKVRELIAMGYQCDPSVADDLDADAKPESP